MKTPKIKAPLQKKDDNPANHTEAGEVGDDDTPVAGGRRRSQRTGGGRAGAGGGRCVLSPLDATLPGTVPYHGIVRGASTALKNACEELLFWALPRSSVARGGEAIFRTTMPAPAG